MKMGLCGVVVMLSLCGFLTPALGDKHSLYYIYTSLSKNVEGQGIYDFTAMGLLDDREIDYYNSKDQMKIPRQDWMREKMQPDYWVKGTQSRKSKEQWFKVNVDILMQRMRHNQSDLHILQWRHGCEIDDTNGKIKYLSGIDEYSYDGSEFLSFDDENMRWVAPVPAAQPTKRKWDDVAILNQYTKGYLEKECVDWLTKFMAYGQESLRNHSRPDVHVFAKKSLSDPKKLMLTCLATGFYPKDMKLSVRKFRTSLPEHLLTSSGVRPNEDGTYQLRKSVDVEKEDTAGYDCHVNHVTLKEPIIKKWDDTPGGVGVIIGPVVGLLVLVAVLGLIIFLKKKGIIGTPLQHKHQKCQQDDMEVAKVTQETHVPDKVVIQNDSPNGQQADMEDAKDPQTDGSESSSDSGRGSGSKDSSNEAIDNSGDAASSDAIPENVELLKSPAT